MMLPSRHYESDHTRFMRELLPERPDLIEKQREGRAIWWDKTPARSPTKRKMDQGRVAQSAIRLRRQGLSATRTPFADCRRYCGRASPWMK